MKEKEPWEFNSYAEWEAYDKEWREHDYKVTKRYVIATIILGPISILLQIVLFVIEYL